MKIFFTPLMAYMAMENDVKKKNGKFVLKMFHTVKVSWY